MNSNIEGTPMSPSDWEAAHSEHIAKGIHGEEKTIGLAFFRPERHCSVCRDNAKRHGIVS